VTTAVIYARERDRDLAKKKKGDEPLSTQHHHTIGNKYKVSEVHPTPKICQAKLPALRIRVLKNWNEEFLYEDYVQEVNTGRKSPEHQPTVID
jgi:hypothetical protein